MSRYLYKLVGTLEMRSNNNVISFISNRSLGRENVRPSSRSDASHLAKWADRVRHTGPVNDQSLKAVFIFIVFTPEDH